MRSRYLKAVLRQDVVYIDLHETSTSVVVTSISNDIQIIQDVLSEKVPYFQSKVSMFVEMAREFEEMVCNIMMEAGKPNLGDYFSVLRKIDPHGRRQRMT